MTLERVRAKVAARAASRKRVEDENRLFRNGVGSDYVDEAVFKGQQRQTAVVKAVRLLEEESFAGNFQALSLLAVARIPFLEARKLKAVHYVRSLMDSDECPAPLRCLSSKLAKMWQAEKKAAGQPARLKAWCARGRVKTALDPRGKMST